MNKKEKNTEKGKEMLELNNQDLTSEDIFKMTQELAQEFIDTKKRISTDDRKLNAIGKALIEQKEALGKIYEVQSSHGMELTESLGDVFVKQEGISKQVFKLSHSMKELQGVKAEQEKYVSELNQFQDSHDELVELSKDQSKQSIERLEHVSEQVAELFEQIDSVDIEGRVDDISKRTANVDELLKSHADKQAQAREDASANMLDLLAEVTSFRRQLSDEGLFGQLTEIQSASDKNKQKIDDLDEKFDIFVEVYELSQIDNDENLEDLFQDEDGDFFNEEDDLTNEVLENVSESDKLEKEIDESSEEVLEKDKMVDGFDKAFNEDESVKITELEGLRDSITEDEIVDEEDLVAEEEQEEEDALATDEDLSEEEDSADEELEDGPYMDEIPEYGRVDEVEKTIGSRKDKKEQGFFSKLFGGR